MLSTSAMPSHHALSADGPLFEALLTSLGPGWSTDVPLVRIRTCGSLQVEVLLDLPADSIGGWQPVYGPPTPQVMAIKGMSTTLLLLALLASQPGGFASKDWLTQTLPYLRRAEVGEEELEEDRALSRLDNVVSLLRKLLCPPGLLAFPQAPLLRKHLVRFVRATAQSGPGYQLAPLPLLWLDVEAMEQAVVRARQLEGQGEDGLEAWQAASQIGMRGPFLAHEPYSEWADWRRGRVADLLWQSVSAQCRRALQRGEDSGSLEAAARLLLDYWQNHPTHEDAFGSLLDVLGRQGRFPQAEQCYRHLCAALEREGLVPQPRTQEAMARVRLQQHEAESPPRSKGSWEVAGKAGETAVERVVAETRHLIGREAWLSGVQQMVRGFPAKKLLILQGPIGIGKSSELIRLAQAFQSGEPIRPHVIWLPLPAVERSSGGPEAVLDLLLATLLSEGGLAPLPAEAPRGRLIAALLTHLEQQHRPTIILLDNAECLLEEDGSLAACWEGFLTQFVRSRHQVSLLLATKEWHGWPGRETIFVAESFVPPLTQQESVRLLQRLGLQEVPIEYLEAVSLRVAGIPLLLEWTAKLVADPLLLDRWESLHEQESLLAPSDVQEQLARRLQRVIEDPSLLGEHLANKLTPLLQRIIERHLSEEARLVLQRLSLAPIPLGKPALQQLCPRPRLLKELRDASLLAAYTNRVQVLPMVAQTVRQQLTLEQRQQREETLIQAYRHWLNKGDLDLQEAGHLVTEVAVLLLMHHRLSEVADLLIRLGWLCFQCGYGVRLALLTQDVLRQTDWHQSIEQECVGLALIQTVFPFLGKPLRLQAYADYPRLQAAFLAGNIALPATIERNTTHLLLLDAIESLTFEQGQAIVDAYAGYLEARHIKHPRRRTGLMQEQALLLSKWCDYLLEQQKEEQASTMREQAIALYRQCVTRFATLKTSSRVAENIRKKALAYASAYLGYHLNQVGQHEEALQMIEQAIHFHAQGYGYTSILADSYSEKAQALMALGRFQEALRFDEQAMAEIHRWAKEGDIHSQEDIWTYQVNRGRLYLRLGRRQEAEQLLQEAEAHLSQSRRNYRMFAKQALEEIAQWRQQSGAMQHQLDWRWVERFRTLTAYDSYWWLTWAGPFTCEEQQQWDRFFTPPLDETSREQLGALMTASRKRELAAALDEQREPHLHYPAIEMEEIRRRIDVQEQLDAEIAQQEPHAIVKKLYHEAILEELDYLQLIKATYERDTERFWQCAQRLYPLPTRAEMIDALGYVQSLIEQALAASTPAARQSGERLQEYLATQLHLPPDVLAEAAACGKNLSGRAGTPSSARRFISAQAAQRFFASVLEESGYEGWRVVLDPHGGMERVERGARCLFLPDKRFPLAEIRHLFVHELAGHVERSVAGERSTLGLLGLQMKNSGPTHEGVALYHERQILASNGEVFDDSGMRMGMLGVGLAAGVITPPQTFSKLCAFFERLTLLIYALNHPQTERTKAQRSARRYALNVTLRKYRGVPDLEQAGICYPQDVIHLRGLRQVEQAVAADASVLERLAVGACALEHLPDLQELGMLSAPQPLLHLAYASDLDEYICSFESRTEKGGI